MLERIFSMLAAAIQRRPGAALGLLLLPTLALGYLAATVQQDLSFSALLPKAHPLIKPFWRAMEDFGATSELLIVLEGEDPEQLMGAMTELAPRLQASPLVREVLWSTPQEILGEHALLFLPAPTLSQLAGALDEEAPALSEALATPGAASPLLILQALLQGQDTLEIGDTPDAPDLFTPWSGLLGAYALALTQDLTPLELEGALGDALAGRWPEAGRMRDPSGAFLSPDGRLLLGRIRLAVDPLRISFGAEGVGALYALTDATLSAHPGVSAQFTGLSAVAYEDQSYVLGQIQILSPISLLLMLVLFFYVDRGLRTPLMVGVAMVVALLWTFGLVHLIFGVVTAMGAIFGILLFGLGVDYAVHLVVRFREELSRGHPRGDALSRAMVRTGPSIVAGAATTAMAFFTLLGFEMSSTDQLGVTTGVGILCCLVSMMTVLPALILRFGTHGPGGDFREDLPWLDRWVGGVVAHPRWVLGITGGLVAAALMTIPGMHLETDVAKSITTDLPAFKASAKVSERFGISSDFAMAFADSVEESRALGARLEALPEVTAVEGIHQLIPPDQETRLPLARAVGAKLGALLPDVPGPPPGKAALAAALQWQEDAATELAFVAELSGEDAGEAAAERLRRGAEAAAVAARALEDPTSDARFARLEAFARGKMITGVGRLAAQRGVEPLTVESLPASLRGAFVGESGRMILRIRSDLNLMSLEGGDRLRQALGTVTSDTTGIHDLANAMVTGGLERLPWVGGVLVGLITLGLLLGFRDVYLVVYALVPLMVSGILALGLTLVTGHSLSMMVAASLPLILGIGIDDGIHVVLRWRELTGEGMAMEEALREATHRTGRAILMTTVTTMSGFGVLLFIHHTGIRAMSTMVTLGVGLCFISSVTVLPAVVSTGERLRRRGGG